MNNESAAKAPLPDPTHDIAPGDTITAWAVSALSAADFAGEPAPAEDRVGYRFINGFVDVGDLPCRKAFWATMVGRPIEPSRGWPVARLNLPGANRRVEFTGFWHTPTHVLRWLASTFRLPARRSVPFRLATCGGVRIFVNGSEQVRFEPFRRNVESFTDITLALEAGDNEILLLSEDLAERDTIWFFELELRDETPLTVVLPVALDQDEIHRLAAFARDARPSRDVFCAVPLEILFDTPAVHDLPVRVEVHSHGHDRAVLATAALVLQAGSVRLVVPQTLGIPDGYHGVRLEIGSGSGTVARVIDAAFLSSVTPRDASGTLAERKAEALLFSARHGADRAGRAVALLAAGIDDAALLEKLVGTTLASIDRREDCSDFVMVPLLWLVGDHGDRLPAALAACIKQSVLGYRYWVDEPGNDVMWFWSENHVLCFHVSQLLAGQLFSDDRFEASGRSGREQAQLAASRLEKWFDSVEAHGLAEWNSAAYYPVDFIGLLAIERFAPSGLAARARRMLDLIFEMIALHTLAGVPAGSQGRAYDKELRAGPLTELAPFAHVAFGGGWLNGGVASLPLFCAGGYAPPAHLCDLARLAPGRMIEARYAQGLEPGQLVLFKNEAAQLSTVVDHKTGRGGHQQHVLDIKLSGHPMARLWVNHPGEDDPWGTQRPSYWAGSGILPRVAQHRDVALMIFDTGEHRNGWTHAYLGRDGLDEVEIEGNWLITRSGRGFAALYSTNGLQLVSGGATDGREVRSEGRLCGWVAVIGCRGEAEFVGFRERILQTSVAFDRTSPRLVVTPPGHEDLDLRFDGRFSVGGVSVLFDHLQPEPVITFDSHAPAPSQVPGGLPFYASPSMLE